MLHQQVKLCWIILVIFITVIGDAVTFDIIWSKDPIQIQQTDGNLMCKNSNDINSQQYYCNYCGEKDDIVQNEYFETNETAVLQCTQGETITVTVPAMSDYNGVVYFQLCEISNVDMCSLLYVIESGDYSYNYSYIDKVNELTLQIPADVILGKYALRWNLERDNGHFILCTHIQIIDQSNKLKERQTSQQKTRTNISNDAFSTGGISNKRTSSTNRIQDETENVTKSGTDFRGKQFTSVETVIDHENNISDKNKTFIKNNIRYTAGTIDDTITVVIDTESEFDQNRETRLPSEELSSENMTNGNSSSESEKGKVLLKIEQVSDNTPHNQDTGTVLGTLLSVVLDYLTGTSSDKYDSTIHFNEGSSLIKRYSTNIGESTMSNKPTKDLNDIQPLVLTGEISIIDETDKGNDSKIDSTTMVITERQETNHTNDFNMTNSKSDAIPQDSNTTVLNVSSNYIELTHKSVLQKDTLNISVPNVKQEFFLDTTDNNGGTNINLQEILYPGESSIFSANTSKHTDEDQSSNETSLNFEDVYNTEQQKHGSLNGFNSSGNIYEVNKIFIDTKPDVHNTFVINESRTSVTSHPDLNFTQLNSTSENKIETIVPEYGQNSVPYDVNINRTIQIIKGAQLSPAETVTETDTAYAFIDNSNRTNDHIGHVKVDDISPENRSDNNATEDISNSSVININQNKTDLGELSSVNLYGVYIPPTANIAVNSIQEKRKSSNTKMNTLQNYIKAQITQMKELSPAPSESRKDDGFTMGSKDLMELILNPKNQFQKLSKRAQSKDTGLQHKYIPSLSTTKQQLSSKRPHLSWLSGKTMTINRIKHRRTEPLYVALPKSFGLITKKESTDKISQFDLYQPSLAFARNSGNIRRTRISKKKRKRKQRKSKRGSKSKSSKKSTSKPGSVPTRGPIKSEMKRNIPSNPLNSKTKPERTSKGGSFTPTKHNKAQTTQRNTEKKKIYNIKMENNMLSTMDTKRTKDKVLDIPPKPRPSKIVLPANVYGINIQSVIGNNIANEAKYKTITDAIPEVTTTKTKSQLHPNYIIAGTVNISDAKNKTPTKNLAETVISDLLDKNILEKEYTSKVSNEHFRNKNKKQTSGQKDPLKKGSSKSKETRKGFFLKSSIDTEVVENSLHSEAIKKVAMSTDISKPLDNNGKLKSSGKSKVIADLIQMGFIDRESLPLIDLTNLKSTYISEAENNANRNTMVEKSRQHSVTKSDGRNKEKAKQTSIGTEGKAKQTTSIGINSSQIPPTESAIKVIVKNEHDFPNTPTPTSKIEILKPEIDRKTVKALLVEKDKFKGNTAVKMQNKEIKNNISTSNQVNSKTQKSRKNRNITKHQKNVELIQAAKLQNKNNKAKQSPAKSTKSNNIEKETFDNVNPTYKETDNKVSLKKSSQSKVKEQKSRATKSGNNDYKQKKESSSKINKTKTAAVKSTSNKVESSGYSDKKLTLDNKLKNNDKNKEVKVAIKKDQGNINPKRQSLRTNKREKMPRKTKSSKMTENKDSKLKFDKEIAIDDANKKSPTDKALTNVNIDKKVSAVKTAKKENVDENKLHNNIQKNDDRDKNALDSNVKEIKTHDNALSRDDQKTKKLKPNDKDKKEHDSISQPIKSTKEKRDKNRKTSQDDDIQTGHDRNVTSQQQIIERDTDNVKTLTASKMGKNKDNNNRESSNFKTIIKDKGRNKTLVEINVEGAQIRKHPTSTVDDTKLTTAIKSNNKNKNTNKSISNKNKGINETLDEQKKKGKKNRKISTSPVDQTKPISSIKANNKDRNAKKATSVNVNQNRDKANASSSIRKTGTNKVQMNSFAHTISKKPLSDSAQKKENTVSKSNKVNKTSTNMKQSVSSKRLTPKNEVKSNRKLQNKKLTANTEPLSHVKEEKTPNTHNIIQNKVTNTTNYISDKVKLDDDDFDIMKSVNSKKRDNTSPVNISDIKHKDVRLSRDILGKKKDNTDSSNTGIKMMLAEKESRLPAGKTTKNADVNINNNSEYQVNTTVNPKKNTSEKTINKSGKEMKNNPTYSTIKQPITTQKKANNINNDGQKNQIVSSIVLKTIVETSEMQRPMIKYLRNTTNVPLDPPRAPFGEQTKSEKQQYVSEVIQKPTLDKTDGALPGDKILGRKSSNTNMSMSNLNASRKQNIKDGTAKQDNEKLLVSSTQNTSSTGRQMNKTSSTGQQSPQLNGKYIINKTTVNDMSLKPPKLNDEISHAKQNQSSVKYMKDSKNSARSNNAQTSKSQSVTKTTHALVNSSRDVSVASTNRSNNVLSKTQQSSLLKTVRTNILKADGSSKKNTIKEGNIQNERKHTNTTTKNILRQDKELINNTKKMKLNNKLEDTRLGEADVTKLLHQTSFELPVKSDSGSKSTNTLFEIKKEKIQANIFPSVSDNKYNVTDKSTENYKQYVKTDLMRLHSNVTDNMSSRNTSKRLTAARYSPRLEYHLQSTGVKRLKQTTLYSKHKTPILDPDDLKEILKRMNNTHKPKEILTSIHTDTNALKGVGGYLMQKSKAGLSRDTNSVSYTAVIKSRDGQNKVLSDKNSQEFKKITKVESNTNSKLENQIMSVNLGETSEKRSDKNSTVKFRGTDNTAPTTEPWPSLASGTMEQASNTPGMAINGQDAAIITGQFWPALVSRNLQWTDTAPHSMSLSIGHNTDGTYISDPLTNMNVHGDFSHNNPHSLGLTQSGYPSDLDSNLDKVDSKLHHQASKQYTDKNNNDNIYLVNSKSRHMSQPSDVKQNSQQSNSRPGDRQLNVVTYNKNSSILTVNNKQATSGLTKLQSRKGMIATGKPSNVFRFTSKTVDITPGQVQWPKGKNSKPKKMLSFSGSGILNDRQTLHSGLKQHYKVYPTVPDFKSTTESLGPNVQMLSSVLKVTLPKDAKPSPHYFTAQTPTNQNSTHSRKYFIKEQNLNKDTNNYSRNMDIRKNYPTRGTNTQSTKQINQYPNKFDIHSGQHQHVTGHHTEPQSANTGYRTILENQKPPNNVESNLRISGIMIKPLQIKTTKNIESVSELYTGIKTSKGLDQKTNYQHTAKNVNLPESELTVMNKFPGMKGLFIASANSGSNSHSHNQIQLNSNGPFLSRKPSHLTDMHKTMSANQAFIPISGGIRAAKQQVNYEINGNRYEVLPLGAKLPVKPESHFFENTIPKSNGLKIISTNTDPAANGIQNINNQRQIHLSLPSKQIHLEPPMNSKRTVHFGKQTFTKMNRSVKSPSLEPPGKGLIKFSDINYNTQNLFKAQRRVPRHLSGARPFSLNLRQYQRQVYPEFGGTRQMRVQSLNEKPIVENSPINIKNALKDQIVDLNGQLQMRVPLSEPNGVNYTSIKTKVVSNPANNNGRGSRDVAVKVNIRDTRNISTVCFPDESFKCNPVGNHALVPGLRDWCMVNCKEGMCPGEKCTCFCVSMTTHDVRNIIVEQQSKRPLQKQSIRADPRNHKITKKRINIFGSITNNVTQNKTRHNVICRVTKLFAKIRGMYEWCNTKCNSNTSNCPTHICNCHKGVL